METANFGGPPPKTIGATKVKYGTIDYVREGNPHAKLGNSGTAGGGGASLYMGEI